MDIEALLIALFYCPLLSFDWENIIIIIDYDYDYDYYYCYYY